MRVTEKQRLTMALEMIEEITADAQSLHPEAEWKQSAEAVGKIYEIVHSIRAPKCRKNHPKWVKQIDDAVRQSKK